MRLILCYTKPDVGPYFKIELFQFSLMRLILCYFIIESVETFRIVISILFNETYPLLLIPILR